MKKCWEFEFKHLGKKQPKYVESEYGYGDNPPAIVCARTKRLAIKKLKLPKLVKIKRIRRG